MATVANRPKPIEKGHAPRMLAPRLGERAAIEAVGEFVITIEEALPKEVTGTAEVAKQVTESGFVMTDRLVHTGNGLLRDVVHSAAKSLSRHDAGKPVAI